MIMKARRFPWIPAFEPSYPQMDRACPFTRALNRSDDKIYIYQNFTVSVKMR